MKLELSVSGTDLPTEERMGNQVHTMEASWQAMLHECDQCESVKMIAGDYESFANKALLSLRIPYFKDALSHISGGTKTVQIPSEISPDTLKLIRSYAYFIQPTVTMENAQELMESAAFLRIEDLWKFCDLFMAKRVVLTLENCLQVRSYALVRSAKFLAKAADQFIAKNCAAILESDGIKDLSQKELEYILSPDEIESLPNEETFWEALEKWVAADEQNRKKLMPQLIKHLRLPCLNLGFINRKLLICPYVDESPECRQIIQALLCFKTSPNNSEFRQACAAEFTLKKWRDPQQFHVYVFPFLYPKSQTAEINVLLSPSHKLDKLNLDNFPQATAVCLYFWRGVVVRNCVYCMVSDGRFIVYNPIAMSWLVVEGDEGRPEEMEHNDGMLVTYGEKLFFCSVGDYSDGTDLLSWEYDAGSNTWKKDNAVPMEGKDFANSEIQDYRVVAVRKEDTELLCFFGYIEKDDGTICDFMQLVNPQTGQSTKGCPMPSKSVIECGAVASYNGKIIVAGGLLEDDTYSSTVQMYDVASNEWCSMPDMIVTRCDFALVVANECLYAIGGTTNEAEVSIEYLDLNAVYLGWQPACDQELFGDAGNNVSFAVACQFPE